MRKNVTGLALVFACASILTVPAFAGEPTVDDVLALYAKGGATVNEMNCDVDMAANVNISVPDAGEAGTFAINGDATMTIAMVLDPLAAHINMDMSGDAMGQGGEVTMEVYMAAKEDGSIGIYASGDAMGEVLDWEYTAIPAEAAAQFMDALKQQQQKPATELMAAIPFELAGETVDVGGITCYELTASMTWDDLKKVITTALDSVKEVIPEEGASSLESVGQTLEMAGALLGGLKFNIEIDVDKETGRPARAYFDTEGSDWTILGALFAQYANLTKDDGTLMDVNLSVDNLFLEYLYDYATPVEITIPEEAVAAEANGTVIDPENAEGLLGEAFGEIAG